MKRGTKTQKSRPERSVAAGGSERLLWSFSNLPVHPPWASGNAEDFTAFYSYSRWPFMVLAIVDADL